MFMVEINYYTVQARVDGLSSCLRGCFFRCVTLRTKFDRKGSGVGDREPFIVFLWCVLFTLTCISGLVPATQRLKQQRASECWKLNTKQAKTYGMDHVGRGFTCIRSLPLPQWREMYLLFIVIRVLRFMAFVISEDDTRNGHFKIDNMYCVTLHKK